MNLFLIRHGKSIRYRIGIWGRRHDVALDKEYVSEIDEAKHKLSSLQGNVFSSPMARCYDTAVYIFGLHRKINVVHEFVSPHSGEFEDKQEKFLRDNYPEYFQISFKERFTYPKYGEESIFDQTYRVAEGFLKVLRAATEKKVFIATHFSVINIIGNIVRGNRDIPSYAEGKFDLNEGEFIELQVNVEKAKDTTHKIIEHI